MGKSCSEVNFTLCFDDANKDEIERLHHVINEMESENGCNRLLITKLEDELLMIQKSESRAVSHIIGYSNATFTWRLSYQKQDRDLKFDKLKVLRYKVKSIASKLQETPTHEEIEKPRMHHNELAVLEDELKLEYDVLNNLVKVVDSSRKSLAKLTEENQTLVASIKELKSDINGELEFYF